MLKFCIITFSLLMLEFCGAIAEEVKSIWMKELPYESWMNAMLMGVKVGNLYMHVDRTTYKGESVLRINSIMHTEIKRFGISIKNSKTKMFYLKDDLTPMYFLSKSDETGQEKIVEGIITNGNIKIKTTLEGKTTEKQQTIPPNTFFAEAIEEITVRKGLKPGNKFSLNVFSLDFFDIMKVDVYVGNKENITYKGKNVEVFAVDYTMNIMGGITTREWITSEGEVYKMEMAKLGMSFVKVEKDEAMGDVGQLDLILKTKIELVGERPSSGIKNFKVKVSIPEGNIRSTFVNNSRQKILPNSDPSQGIIELTVKDIDENSALRRPITRKELAQYLAPSIYVQSDDPEIINKAQEIAGSETNSWKAAVKICKWVNESIKDKNYKVGFGTAKQTLKELQGDCSEHTVLFIGLARALGIPSRICTGIVFHRDAFYYHFWPEVYIGKWISMEPTLGQMQADATHIQFNSKPIETESALELGEGVLKTMNRLQIERVSE
ncbi:MAG: transglutaminase domain-containing protein [bacterium]